MNGCGWEALSWPVQLHAGVREYSQAVSKARCSTASCCLQSSLPSPTCSGLLCLVGGWGLLSSCLAGVDSDRNSQALLRSPALSPSSDSYIISCIRTQQRCVWPGSAKGHSVMIPYVALSSWLGQKLRMTRSGSKELYARGI